MIETNPESVATESLPNSIRTLWRIFVLIETALLLAGSVAVAALVGRAVVLVGLVALIGGFAALQWWIVDLRFRSWRWGLDDRWIERRSGVLVRTTQIVPRSRVQTLTTRTGPIDRRLGLSAIVVHTAGTHTPNLVIPHLESRQAERIRAELGG